MGQGDYSITEFAHRLAQVEAKYGKEMLEIIECFTNSRVDLPVKKLDDLSRAHMKCARHLRKMDHKKEECINLWKLCNIYSSTAVDVDDAMREIRSALRKRLKPKESSKDVSAFRRLIDEYRPARKTTNSSDQQHDIYDKPTNKEKQRWLEMTILRRKKDDKKGHDDGSRKSKVAPKPPAPTRNNTLNITVPALDLTLKRKPQVTPNANYEPTPEVYDTPITPPLGLGPPALPSCPPPPLLPTKLLKASEIVLDGKEDDEEWTEPTYDEGTMVPNGVAGSGIKEVVLSLPQSPAVFEASKFLEQLPFMKDSLARSEKIETPNNFTNEETVTVSPLQISPGIMYKPIAPPKPDIIATNKTRPGSSDTDSSEFEIPDATPVLRSHTMIEILPSSDGYSDRVQTIENGEEILPAERVGVVARNHSIKINNNSIKQTNSGPLRLDVDGSYLVTVPGCDYSIVVNHL